MLTNKDIRVENGNIVINGDKYPLDGQSPEAIMAIVEDNSDTTPTENSTAPITSGGVYTALAGKEDTLTFDTTPTAESANPVTSAGIKTYVDDIGTTTQLGSLVANATGDVLLSDDIDNYRFICFALSYNNIGGAVFASSTLPTTIVELNNTSGGGIWLEATGHGSVHFYVGQDGKLYIAETTVTAARYITVFGIK